MTQEHVHSVLLGGSLEWLLFTAKVRHYVAASAIVLRLMAGLRLSLAFASLICLPACRTAMEGDAAAKRETAGGVSVVAVQYVVSVSWPFSNFTDPSHSMV